MKITLISTGALILLLCLGCDKNSRENVNADTAQSADFKTEDVAYGLADSTTAGNQQQQQQPQRNKNTPPGQPVTNEDWDRKIVKTATLSLEVNDYKNYYTVLRESVKRTGGYIASEDQQQSEYKLENTVAVKVPVAQFEEAMTLLSSGTGKDKIVERKITSQDVTGEVVDTKSRMEAKRQVRLRYLDLLNQAKNMEDILKVQEEINAIQEEIEMGTGRVNYLNNASAMSTIHLTFYQVLNPTAQTPTDPSFFTRSWYAFERGWNFIKDIIIGIVTLWPLLLAGFGIWLGVRRWKVSKVKA
ncbi:MAG: DUF4349 domain-containing protein [Chitinophagaceae bacterium]